MNTISGWETGKRGINLDDLSRLAGVYKVSAADLLQSPEAYEQRQDLLRLAAVANRLTHDQVEHLIWFGEAIIPVEPQPAGLDPPLKPKRRDHLPFPLGGNIQENRVSRTLLRLVQEQREQRACPVVEVEGR